MGTTNRCVSVSAALRDFSRGPRSAAQGTGVCSATVAPRVDILGEENGSIATPRGLIHVRWNQSHSSVEDGKTANPPFDY